MRSHQVQRGAFDTSNVKCCAWPRDPDNSQYGTKPMSIRMHLTLYCHFEGAPMAMNESQIYRCQNRSCSCEVRVLRTSIQARANPRCCCGAEMKKPYRKPAWRTLSSDTEVLTFSRSNRK
jgi:hypothetical protein